MNLVKTLCCYRILRILVVLTLTPQQQARLPKGALPPCFPQSLDLALIQSPPDDVLELLLADLLQRLFLFCNLVPRLEPCLHPYPHRASEVDGFGVTSHIRAARLRVIDCYKCIAPRLKGKSGWVVGDRNDGEGLGGRYGGRRGAQYAIFVGAKIAIARCQTRC